MHISSTHYTNANIKHNNHYNTMHTYNNTQHLGPYTNTHTLPLPNHNNNANNHATTNNHLRLPHMRGTVISDISFESGLSDDYALPPDAVSESTCMDASMPSLLMRQSYVDSPSKKLESLEKVSTYAKYRYKNTKFDLQLTSSLTQTHADVLTVSLFFLSFA